MQVIVVIKTQRSLHCVNKWNEALIEHDCPCCRSLLVWNVIATAVVSKCGCKIGKKFGKYPALIVLWLGDVVARTKYKHVFLSGMAMKVKIYIYVMCLRYLIHQIF